MYVVVAKHFVFVSCVLLITRDMGHTSGRCLSQVRDLETRVASSTPALNAESASAPNSPRKTVVTPLSPRYAPDERVSEIVFQFGSVTVFVTFVL